MRAGDCEQIVAESGFRWIGSLGYGLPLGLWWLEQAKVSLITLDLGEAILVKGTKSYHLRAISEEGQTWARDIGGLHDYLETHFPEVHISMSFFRDVPKSLARRHVAGRMGAAGRAIPDSAALERLDALIQQARRRRRADRDIARFIDRGSNLLRSHLSASAREEKGRLRSLEQEAAQARRDHQFYEQLQSEYLAKGSALSLTFTLASGVHLASSAAELRDAIASVVKELDDAHRYQVRQKLGGKLNIQVEETTDPTLIWLEQWMGGALPPRQLERLNAPQQLAASLTVTPDETITVEGVTQEHARLVPARIVSALVQRLDTEGAQRLTGAPDPASMPAWIGTRLGSEACRAVVPLASLTHAYISGATGSGKSYTARVLIEEAAAHESLGILVIDPRNQAAGLLAREDRPSILERYRDFRMDPGRARSFELAYHAPASDWAAPLPQDLGQLARVRSIVSLKGLDEADRCRLMADILDGVFTAISAEESDRLRLLVVVDEAQLFTKKRVGQEARAQAERAETGLDRMMRESRKYGCCVIIVSQTIRDFSHGAAAVRQNANTKIFMHNSDREVEYAADYLGDGRKILRLRPGEAIVWNAAWGAAACRIRPPWSKVWEFSDAETRRLLSSDTPTRPLSQEARELLSAVAQAEEPLNITEAGELAGITSKRRLGQLIKELERAGRIRTRTLPQRGRPRIIQLIADGTADAMDSAVDEDGLDPNHGRNQNGHSAAPAQLRLRPGRSGTDIQSAQTTAPDLHPSEQEPAASRDAQEHTP
ncbi:MAG: ATP-binding protein [Phycisphaerales bacterium JB039]